MGNTTGTQAAPVVYPLAEKRVWVAGHRGMAGSALVRRLAVDLRRQGDVEA